MPERIEKDKSFDRPWQPKVIDRILTSVSKGKNKIILDAPTGSGKTLIALYTLRKMLRDKSYGVSHAYIAVRTINEMHPYNRDMIAFNLPLTYKYLVGKRRGCAYWTEGDDNNSSLCDSCLRRKTSKNGEAEFDEDNARRVIRSQVVKKQLPRGLAHLEKKYTKDKRAQICLYHSLKHISSDVDLLTFPYITNEKIRKASSIDLENSLLIVDEAHNLEGASTLREPAISNRSLNTTLSEFHTKCLRLIKKDDKDEWAARVVHAVEQLSSVVEEFVELAGRDRAKHLEKSDFASKVDQEVRDLVSEAYSEVDSVKRKLANERSIDTLKNPFYGIHEFLDALGEEDCELFSESDGRIALKTVDPASELSGLNDAKILLMMSGTMPRSDYVEKVWGIPGCEEINVLQDYSEDYYSVFPRDSKRTVWFDNISSAYRERSGERWAEKYGEVVENAFNSGKLSTLVCCTSYTVARQIYEVINVPKYLETSETSTDDVLSAIISTMDSRLVIVAVSRGKILEGVEFTRDGSSLIDSVVLAGIPYPVPDDLQKMKASRVMGRLGINPNDGDFKFKYFMDVPALITVKQAAGRAIRFPKDRATIYLADRRFKEKFWASEFGKDSQN